MKDRKLHILLLMWMLVLTILSVSCKGVAPTSQPTSQSTSQSTSTIQPSLSGRDTEVAQPASEGGALGGALYLEAVRQRLAGNRDAAYELLAECLRINPNSQEALYDMANLKLSVSALIDSTSVAEGDSLLRRAYAVDTTNTDVRDRLAHHLLTRGDYIAATHLYERIANGRHVSANDLGILMQLYALQGKYDKALSTIDRMEMLDEPDARTAWERFEIYRCTGQEERALALYDSLLVKAMPDPETPEYVRMQLMRQPMYEHKVRTLRDSLISALESHEAYRIGALCRQGQVYEPQFLPYYYYEALSHLMNANRPGALEACQRSFDYISLDDEGEMSPTDSITAGELYTFAGDIYTDEKNIEAAVEMYDNAVRFNKLSASLLNNYAYQLALLGRELDKAEEMSRQAVASEPDNDTYLDTLAWVLYRKGKYREARKYIDEACRKAVEIDNTLREHRKTIYNAR